MITEKHFAWLIHEQLGKEEISYLHCRVFGDCQIISSLNSLRYLPFKGASRIAHQRRSHLPASSASSKASHTSVWRNRLFLESTGTSLREFSRFGGLGRRMAEIIDILMDQEMTSRNNEPEGLFP